MTIYDVFKLSYNFASNICLAVKYAKEGDMNGVRYQEARYSGMRDIWNETQDEQIPVDIEFKLWNLYRKIYRRYN